MTDKPFTIRTLSSVEDYQKAEAAQQRFWGMQDTLQVTALPVLITMQKNGGLVAGAFDTNGEMIGVLFGFLGMTPEGKIKHCSHIMGIDPTIRRQKIGEAMKLFQRDHVLKQGLDLISWTFDPLEGVNASLNIGKLGAVTHKYYDNLYGEMPDGLNAGLPSDRFEVEWWIDSPHVHHRLKTGRTQHTAKALIESGAVQVNPTHIYHPGESAHPVIEQIARNLSLEADTLLVEVPPVFQAIKATSPRLAQEWRRNTGEIFKTYFKNGYTVTDFLTDQQPEEPTRRNFYVLSRNFSPGISHDV